MKLKIAIMNGDDIGIEIVPMAKLVLVETLKSLGYSIELIDLPIGKLAHIEYGNTFPEYTINQLNDVHGIICGPIGHANYPRNDSTWKMPPIRKKFGLYAAIRPAKSYDNSKNIDIIFVRELTEGLQSSDTIVGGYPEFRPNDEITIASRVITRKGSNRVAKAAFDIAVNKNRCKVTAAHKEPLFRLSCGMFLEECAKVSEEYPSISYEDKLIDTTAMHLVSNPESFDIVVTTNQFGDILSDIGAGLIGSIGMAPGLCLGDGIAMAQATHGSAPDIAGKNIANPYAMIMSTSMLLSWMGSKYSEEELIVASNIIEESTLEVIKEKKHLTADIGGKASTIDMTKAIIEKVKAR